MIAGTVRYARPISDSQRAVLLGDLNPPEKYQAALEKGIVVAYYYMQNLATKLFASSLYWPDRHWSFVMVPDAQHGFDFVSSVAVEIDKRAVAWFFFTFYPRVLIDREGTVYLAPIADSGGRILEASRIYKLRVPKDVPAKQFWSVTMYDRRTWAFVNNPLDRAGLGSKFPTKVSRKNAWT
jgi:hypothetical protein